MLLDLCVDLGPALDRLTQRNHTIPVQIQVLTTLGFLATGCYQQQVTVATSSRWILTPFPSPQTAEEMRYNDAHVGARSVLERVTGILNVFRCCFRCLRWQTCITQQKCAKTARQYRSEPGHFQMCHAHRTCWSQLDILRLHPPRWYTPHREPPGHLIPLQTLEQLKDTTPNYSTVIFHV
ncbi:hypothetical protein UPYG_G00246150 [Umbra pygmaea]|uniref:Uncharacterized protein n=1 Tax=Umbra pygmaea TaxID=75934 RepID=A0ABD0WG99_UMBPY